LEYVEGLPIDRYAREHTLDLRQRLGARFDFDLTFNAVAAATLVWHLNLPTFSP